MKHAWGGNKFIQIFIWKTWRWEPSWDI